MENIDSSDLLKHDLNALSQYLLNVTAFTPDVSMGAGGYTCQGHGKDILGSYATILKGIDLSTQLFRSHTEISDYSNIDYDGIGIIFEHGEQYYVIVKPHWGEAENSGWLDKRRVGTHLISEWESLPKLQINRYSIASNGCIGSWWTLHSKTIMHLRRLVTIMARQLQQVRVDNKTVVPEHKFHAALAAQFDKIMVSFYKYNRARKGAQRVEEINEAESWLRKFTSICEED
jgi:hypothetical protein